MLHIGLFLLTLISMIWIGGTLTSRWVVYDRIGPSAFFFDGLRYAIPFLFFLTTHEFGHYFAARRHGISVSLPYYIPLPFLGFGTLGAVIRIREPFRRTSQLFDVGAAGPLAGFVVVVGVLILALGTLPSVEYLLGVGGESHERIVEIVQATGVFPTPDLESAGQVILFNDTPVFALLRSVLPGLPSPSELMHYPLLLAAWLGLFFTALNLLPVGQLDGGHITYALFGAKAHAIIARIATLTLLVFSVVGMGRDFGHLWYAWLIFAAVVCVILWRFFERDWKPLIPTLGALMAIAYAVPTFLPGVAASIGYVYWIVWVGLIVFVIRVDHPPVLIREPLSRKRKLLGYLCLIIFLMCFSPQPIVG